LVAAPWLVDDYATTLLTRALSFGLLAVSVALMSGIAGLPTLGQTAPYAVGAYTTALLVRGGVAVGVVQVSAAAAAGAVFAALTAPLVVRTRGVAVLMVTLAVGELTVTAAGRWRSVTGGTDGLVALTPPRPFWGLPELVTDRAAYLYVLGTAGAVTLAVVLVLRTPAGLLLRGCAQGEARMRASGHHVNRYLAVAYVAAGAVAGIAGSLLVTANRYVSPSDAGFTVAALALLAVVIGGATSLGGALVGAALVLVARDWLTAPLPGHAPLLLGAVFVAATYLLPQGLAGLTRRRPGHRPGRNFVEVAVSGGLQHHNVNEVAGSGQSRNRDVSEVVGPGGARHPNFSEVAGSGQSRNRDVREVVGPGGARHQEFSEVAGSGQSRNRDVDEVAGVLGRSGDE
ncbi:MAG: branched-chain amino acid transport system permease protein, partial [Micromonosporaceae bacterium]